jgi:hypothetical protein
MHQMLVFKHRVLAQHSLDVYTNIRREPVVRVFVLAYTADGRYCTASPTAKSQTSASVATTSAAQSEQGIPLSLQGEG